MKNLFLLLTVILILAGGMLRADVLISDDFTGTNGTLIDGRTPDLADVPQINWQYVGWSLVENGFGSGQANAITNNTLGMSTLQADAFNLASNAYYTKPTSLTLSADLQTLSDGKTGATDTSGPVGLGLGYFSSIASDNTNNSDPQSAFTGFALNFGSSDGSQGSLSLYNNGALVQTFDVTYPGTGFDSNSFYNLTYSVNTNTGAFTNVTYDGMDLTGDFTSTNIFTDANTAYAGVFLSNNVGQNSTFDNFSVSTQSTPEPSTYVLLLGGCLLIAFRFMRQVACGKPRNSP